MAAQARLAAQFPWSREPSTVGTEHGSRCTPRPSTSRHRGLRGGYQGAHRHGMRVVLLVQLGWSRLLRASLAQLGVLVAHLDQSGVHGAWSPIARGGRACWHLWAPASRTWYRAATLHQRTVIMGVKAALRSLSPNNQPAGGTCRAACGPAALQPAARAPLPPCRELAAHEIAADRRAAAHRWPTKGPNKGAVNLPSLVVN